MTEFSLARPTEFHKVTSAPWAAVIEYAIYSVVCVHSPYFYLAAQPLSQFIASRPGLGSAYIAMALMAPTVSIFHSVGLTTYEVRSTESILRNPM